MKITDDHKRFSAICYAVGYMSGRINEDWSDESACEIVAYIRELFQAKRDEIEEGDSE